MDDSTYKIGNLVITPVSGWVDMTSEISSKNPPFTLARNDGVGALQFSVATYVGAKLPAITLDSLNQLLDDFAQSRELRRSFNAVSQEGVDQFLVCARSFRLGPEFIRVWYCSDRRSIALVTYVCQDVSEEMELPDCEQIVSNLKFAY